MDIGLNRCQIGEGLAEAAKPKFANPDEPSRVWAGRGKQPRWVIEKLAYGLVLEDLSIGRGSSVAMPESLIT